MSVLTQVFTARAERPNDNTHAYIVIGAALIAASFALTFIKLAQNSGMPSPLIATGRMLLACLILTPVVLRNYRAEFSAISRWDMLWAGAAGFWMGLHFILLIFALEHTSILVTQVIVNTGPLWVALLEVFFLKAKLPRVVWIGLLLAIVGGGLIAMANAGTGAAGDTSMTGTLLAIAGALAGAGYITIGRKVRAKVSLAPYLWMLFGWGGVTTLAVVLFTGTSIIGHSPEAYFWLIMLTLIPQLVGHSGFNYALRYLPATIVSITTQAVVIPAAVIAFILFTEIPQMLDVVGSAVIMIGVCITILGQRTYKRARAKT